jgi:hypothetical protein
MGGQYQKSYHAGRMPTERIQLLQTTGFDFSLRCAPNGGYRHNNHNHHNNNDNNNQGSSGQAVAAAHAIAATTTTTAARPESPTLMDVVGI